MTINKYKTPGNAIFGLNPKDERVFYKDARAVENNKELIELLKIRNNIFFIKQVQVLDDTKGAFPLVHMTIQGIKNLSKIFSGDSKAGQEQVCHILEQMSPKFSEQVDLNKYVEFWDDRTWKSNSSLSYVFYNLAFSELKRGYVLDYGEEVSIEEWEDFFFRLNPGWLWNSFKGFTEVAFNNLSEVQETLIANYIRTELLQ